MRAGMEEAPELKEGLESHESTAYTVDGALLEGPLGLYLSQRQTFEQAQRSVLPRPRAATASTWRASGLECICSSLGTDVTQALSREGVACVQ
jgi:hypothetical protein